MRSVYYVDTPLFTTVEISLQTDGTRENCSLIVWLNIKDGCPACVAAAAGRPRAALA